ncbi:phage regulatory CII family protein [Escherichia coli]|uniref:phage regulatory CII family protein n=1 Tax=Escherichia coli TaxID=562 RepID=UPI0020251A33|nr:phage regulatory CII family protein [Escherichia coli]
MGNHHWKVEKQPEWYVKAVRKTIAALPGGYAEAAEWLDVTENADINQRLLEVIEQIGSYSKQIRSAIEDGVVEPHEQTAINDELYLSISKLQEHAALVYKIFCVPEKSDARECAAPGVVAFCVCGETNA